MIRSTSSPFRCDYEYRSHVISVDFSSETIRTSVTGEHKTLKAAKTAIDKFVKDNSVFPTLSILKKSYDEVETTTIVGVRKDGRFKLPGKDQISDYGVKDCYLLPNERISEAHDYRLMMMRHKKLRDKLNQDLRAIEKEQLGILLVGLKPLTEWRKENIDLIKALTAD